MLLKALKEFAGTHKDLPDFYDRQEVRYRIDLLNDGTFQWQELSDPDRPKRGATLAIPYLKRTVAIVPLPVDRGDYVLGIPAVKADPQSRANAEARTRLLHASYLELLADAATETGLPVLATMHRFAREYDPQVDVKRPEGFDGSRFVELRVDGASIVENPTFRRWWADRQRGGAQSAVVDGCGVCGVCGVCGRRAPSVKLVPVAIRGLGAIGGKATMALVSGNMDVFERHGLTRATVASICLDCGNATHQALNQLIASPTNAKRLGATIFVWWATEKTPDLIAALWQGDSDEDILRELDSIFTGKAQARIDTSKFYGLSLGANSSRVVVRSWLETTLAEAQSNIVGWFGRTHVVDRSGMRNRRPGLYRLLASLAPQGQGDPVSRIDPRLPTTLVECAITGRALPPSVLHQVLAPLPGRSKVPSPTCGPRWSRPASPQPTTRTRRNT